ncbi:MAG: hypothetical protein ACETV1_03105 [Candidatus Bathyarchaeia archaeon]
MRVDADIPAPSSRGLGGEESGVWGLVRPERGSLARLKQVSLRNRAWFTVLSWKQRRFFDLVIRTVDRIRSGLLLRVLAPLVGRLLTAIGGDARNGALVLMERGAYKMMLGVAEKIVRIAERWGNRSARGWLGEAFVRYLLVMNLPQNSDSVTLASW